MEWILGGGVRSFTFFFVAAQKQTTQDANRSFLVIKQPLFYCCLMNFVKDTDLKSGNSY